MSKINWEKLGTLSEKYESNGEPGLIARTAGDKGGPSYGLYQLAINTGSLARYIQDSRYKDMFNGIKLGSAEFDKIWKELALNYRDEFIEDQYIFHMNTYFKPVRVKANIYELPNTNAVNQVLWSTSTQHGPNWIKNKIPSLEGLKEKDLIKRIYELRKEQFENSEYYNSTIKRRRIRNNVLKRFNNELKEALELINTPKEYTNP